MQLELQKMGTCSLLDEKKAKDNGDAAAEKALEALIFVVNYEKGITGTQTDVKASGSTTIIMNKRNSIYWVPCKINGLKADFVFDTGAGAISLSSDFAKRLVDMGVLSDNDITGKAKSYIADGSVSEVLVVNIKDVEIGGLHLYNVRATIKQQQKCSFAFGTICNRETWQNNDRRL